MFCYLENLTFWHNVGQVCFLIRCTTAVHLYLWSFYGIERKLRYSCAELGQQHDF